MASEAWKRVARAVRQGREQLGLTQAELASKAGVSEPTIRVLETARRTGYQRATLREIASALGWTPDSIDRILDDKPPVESVPSSSGDDHLSLAERAEIAAMKATIEAMRRDIEEIQRREDEREAEVIELRRGRPG